VALPLPQAAAPVVEVLVVVPLAAAAQAVQPEAALVLPRVALRQAVVRVPRVAVASAWVAVRPPPADRRAVPCPETARPVAARLASVVRAPAA
jgi:hypothetical protein